MAGVAGNTSRAYPRDSRTKGKATMASGLYTTLYEVKGEVKLQASSAVSRTSEYRQGALRLSQLGDTFFIQCVHDSTSGKPSKRYKVCRLARVLLSLTN